MSTRRVSLKAFLDKAKKVLASPPARRPNPLTFVIGNESAGKPPPSATETSTGNPHLF